MYKRQNQIREKVAIKIISTTDHRPLGSLFTYYGRIDAEVVVWIAEEFRNEHISQLTILIIF